MIRTAILILRIKLACIKISKYDDEKLFNTHTCLEIDWLITKNKNRTHKIQGRLKKLKWMFVDQLPAPFTVKDKIRHVSNFIVEYDSESRVEIRREWLRFVRNNIHKVSLY